jgi:hypothetical protein
LNKIEFVKDKIPFTQVANGVLTDKRLSAKAKGLYAYLYSKPDGWDFAIDRIALEMSDGRKSINEGLKELEVLGFLTRKRQADGRVLYLVHFPPIEPNAQNGHMDIEPNAQKAIVPKSHMTKMGTVSNKDIIIIKNNTSNKDSNAVALQGIPVIIEAFEKVNKACADFYGNTTQRKYTEKLIIAYGQEMVLKVVSMLPQFNAKFYHKATTPKELWDKWAKISAEAQALKQGRGNKYQITKVY